VYGYTRNGRKGNSKEESTGEVTDIRPKIAFVSGECKSKKWNWEQKKQRRVQWVQWRGVGVIERDSLSPNRYYNRER
jgi:hypothetical protein